MKQAIATNEAALVIKNEELQKAKDQAASIDSRV